MTRFFAAFAFPALAVLALACSDSGDDDSQQPTGTDESTTTPILSEGASAFEGAIEWIAYQAIAGRGEILRLVHPDGTEDHQIAAGAPGEHETPDWSPDGKTIVFQTRNLEHEPLFVYDLASDSFEQLFECTDTCLGDDEPAFSPDGKTVMFMRAVGPLVNDIPTDCGLWVGDIETREITQLTSNEQCNREYDPRWSPDGTQITYSRADESTDPATGSVYVAMADGTGAVALTEASLLAGGADWSPNGEWIVYSTCFRGDLGDCGDSNLFRVHPDGTGVEQLTGFTGEDRARQARYSPDGEWIIFRKEGHNSASLQAIPAEGGDPVPVGGISLPAHPDWQPAE